MSPTLSVLVAHYNHGEYVGTAVEAILAQSYRPAEIILVDDASNDGSIEVVRELARRHPSVRLVENEVNEGVVAVFNKLVALASGDYVVGCAADDILLPGFFERTMEVLAANPDAAICSCLTRLIDEDGEVIGTFESPVIASSTRAFSPASARRILHRYGFWIVGNTAVFKRSALLGVGGFLPQLGPITDSFTEHVLAARHGACFIPEPLAALRVLPTSYSAAAAGDLERFDTHVRAAAEQMAGAYADVFGDRFSRRWQKEMRLSFGLRVLDRSDQAAGEASAVLAELGFAERRTTRALLAGAERMSTLARVLGRLALFSHYTPPYIVRRRALRQRRRASSR